MTIISIFKKIKIHPISYIVIFISTITGLFKELSLFMLIIIIHELGHITGALIYRWKIERIVILPFGGITIFNDCLNKPIKEEFLIVILGPLFQIIGFILLNDFIDNDYFKYYHNIILIFNLLPIIPLDGSKIISLLFNKFFSYKLSHLLMIFLSIICLVIILPFIKVNLLLLLIILFIFIKIIKEYRNHLNLINRFILERYIYDFKFKKRKYLNNTNLKNMYRDYYHLFYNGKNYITESNLLHKMFDIKRNIW